MPGPGRIRFRHILHEGDPGRIRGLVAAAGVFSAEEVEVAGRLAETTLDGTETYRWLIADDGDDLVGYTCFDRIELTKASFDLYWIAVSPDHRGRGLGIELMMRTAKFINTKHGAQIFAETSSREPYAKARAFYAKAGFEQVARFADFYEPGDDKVIYRMKL